MPAAAFESGGEAKLPARKLQETIFVQTPPTSAASSGYSKRRGDCAPDDAAARDGDAGRCAYLERGERGERGEVDGVPTCEFREWRRDRGRDSETDQEQRRIEVHLVLPWSVNLSRASVPVVRACATHDRLADAQIAVRFRRRIRIHGGGGAGEYDQLAEHKGCPDTLKYAPALLAAHIVSEEVTVRPKGDWRLAWGLSGSCNFEKSTRKTSSAGSPERDGAGVEGLVELGVRPGLGGISSMASHLADSAAPTSRDCARASAWLIRSS